ncbi:uncharacterized protein Tco025E_00571 [Trypanosoma conorhini]|uniref:Uncharacterized protein n=1 Tax=Trypanosoma conorhini TaxID=83891 RepID=A0A422QB62_9TRYP|nr:uncharacterized protein Tco025E_00571 [Trypanosoma conorhini]RNF27197.1 hypothetical protein Tco025E_00571 [Trypanosoma conorhini]
MILGVGDGTFAILFVTVFGIIVASVGAYLQPRWALPIGVACLALPFLVYGCIISAPREHPPSVLPATPYSRERQFSVNAVVVDHFFPIRVGAMILLLLALLAAAVYNVMLVVREPPYKAPKVRCLRERLEELHPTWYR